MFPGLEDFDLGISGEIFDKLARKSIIRKP